EITDEHETAQVLLNDGLATLKPDDVRRVQVQILLGTSHERMGNLLEAEQAFLEAFNMAQKAGETPLQLLALAQLSLIEIRLGKFGNAEQFMQKSTHLIGQVQSSSETARAHNHLGLIYMYRGESFMAIEHYQHSISLYQEIGEEWATAMTLNNLGMEYARLHDYERSLSVLQDGFLIRERAGDKWGMASSLNNTGLVATWKRDYERAHEYLSRSLDLYRDIGAKRDIANAIANLSVVELHRGTSEVSNLLDEGVRLADEAGATPIVLELLASYAWYYYQQGQKIMAGRMVQTLKEHPVFNIEVQEKLDEWLPLLERDLTDVEITEIQRQSISLDALLQPLLQNRQ
ncbi:MAG: tetratricopeptide repeat protein, partial [Chloroflexota bacterium]